jgi:iron(III) transport system permease protein
MSRRPSSQGARSWVAASGIIALVVLAPIASLAVVAARGSEGLWEHLIANVLAGATADTLVVLTGVGLLCAVIGAGLAWLVTAFEFAGRRLFDWALLLPMAVPTYIVAYAYLDILHPVGPVQTVLRAILGIDSPRDFRLPDVRSMAGCIILLSFVLYPYVYLTTRAVFLMQSANLLDAARTLGTGRRGVFLRVALPLARPAIVVGLTLVLLETLNDIGASEFLGVRTLTVAVYSTWVTRSDLPGAAQISLTMLLIVTALVLIERRARRHRQYVNDAQHPRPLAPHRLMGWRAGAAAAACATPVLLGFVVPALYLAHATAARVRFAGVPTTIARETLNTVTLSLAATGLALVAGVAVAYAERLGRGGISASLARIASLGYAVPGTVLAIGLLPVVTGIEAVTDAATQRFLGVPTGLFLLGTGAAVVYAYVVRFLALAAGGVEAGLSRIPTSLDDAARTLGSAPLSRLRSIHLPIARPALATAALLVFVDSMKELPATLLLRPLGFETLATHLYGEAVRGTYEDGAIAALLIVLAGLIPVLILARIGRTRPSAGSDVRA